MYPAWELNSNIMCYIFVNSILPKFKISLRKFVGIFHILIKRRSRKCVHLKNVLYSPGPCLNLTGLVWLWSSAQLRYVLYQRVEIHVAKSLPRPKRSSTPRRTTIAIIVHDVHVGYSEEGSSTLKLICRWRKEVKRLQTGADNYQMWRIKINSSKSQATQIKWKKKCQPDREIRMDE